MGAHSKAIDDDNIGYAYGIWIYTYELKVNDYVRVPGGWGKALVITPLPFDNYLLTLDQYTGKQFQQWQLKTTKQSLWMIFTK